MMQNLNKTEEIWQANAVGQISTPVTGTLQLRVMALKLHEVWRTIANVSGLKCQ